MVIRLVAAFLALLPASAAVADGHRCGTAQLRELLPGGVVPPFHGPRPGGRGMPVVGEQRDFWTYDLSVMPPKNAKVAATCRAVGTAGAVWVADDQWGKAVGEAEVTALLAALETATPRSDDAGIIANNEALFGVPPKYHAEDPALTILAYDIAGYGTYTFDGFFRREDLQPYNPACAGNPMVYCSNELGMIHLSVKGLGGDYMNGVVAHEFEHLAHYGQDANEESWLDETMAELAMAFSGYEDPGNVSAWAKDPSLPLIVPPPVNYGACYLFGGYLHQRLGSVGVRELVASKQKGVAAIEGLFTPGFAELFGEYGAALAANDASLDDGRYGFGLFSAPAPLAFKFGSTDSYAAKVAPTALRFVELNWQMEAGKTYELTFRPGQSLVGCHLFLPGPGTVVKLLPDEPLAVPLAVGDSRVLIALANPDPKAEAAVAIDVEVVEAPAPPLPESEDGDLRGEEDLPTGGSDLGEAEGGGGAGELSAEDGGGEVATGDAQPEPGGGSGGGGCSAAPGASGWALHMLLLLGLFLACARRERAAGRRN